MSSKVRYMLSEPGSVRFGSQALRRLREWGAAYIPGGIPLGAKWEDYADAADRIRRARRDLHLTIYRDRRGAKWTPYRAHVAAQGGAAQMGGVVGLGNAEPAPEPARAVRYRIDMDVLR